MVKNYHLDPGYITVPEANRIVLNMLRITNRNEKKHYNKILAAAKQGLYGGKKHGTRMFQVRKTDIIEYAFSCLKDEQIQLYKIEVVQDINKFEGDSNLPLLDNSTAKNIQYYLKYLKVYGIISDEMYQEGERNLVMRIKVKGLRLNK